MKITDSEIIKNGEKELIDAITADLDWGAIEEIFLKEHNLGIEEDIEYKSGDIVAFDNQIAYKLEFEVKVNLSVLLNRNGEYLSVKISDKIENLEGDRDIDIQVESNGTGPNAGTDVHGTASVLSNNDMESEEEKEAFSPGDADETYGPKNCEAVNLNEKISEDPEISPFGDFNDNVTDDMGQKVDDIIENLKKAG